MVLDAGNTNTVLGIFKGKDLIGSWRIRTEVHRTSDEYAVLLNALFQEDRLDPSSVEGVVISCVVPTMMDDLERYCMKYLQKRPLIVEPGIKTGMPIRIDNPREVGADRIVNAVAAFERFRCSLIIVDFGTATTFDAVSERGEFLGGAIAPGVMISCEALFQKASKLPRVEVFTYPRAAVGKDTVSAMESGIVFGFAGMVEGVVGRMKKEIHPVPRVVATGGLARIMLNVCECIEVVDDQLTLEGLRIVYERNL